MSSRNVFTVGRVLMALIFLVAGVRKWINYAATTGYLGSMGVPLPEIALPLIILLEVGGGIALAIGWRTSWVAAILGLFCIGSGLLGHQFWAVDPAQFANQLNHFLKNMAMAGGFLVVLAMSLELRGKDRG